MYVDNDSAGINGRFHHKAVSILYPSNDLHPCAKLTHKIAAAAAAAPAANAAPAAAEIVRRIAPLLGVLPHFENPDEQAALALPTPAQDLMGALADASR